MNCGDPQIAKSPAICSRRRGCFDKRGTVLGSLWDDDNDMILGQAADDRTKKGMQFSIKVRKDLPRHRRRSHPLREARGR